MVDKNGNEVKVGMKVIDIHGNTGEMVVLNGANAIKFEYKGQINYAFEHRVIENQICILED